MPKPRLMVVRILAMIAVTGACLVTTAVGQPATNAAARSSGTTSFAQSLSRWLSNEHSRASLERQKRWDLAAQSKTNRAFLEEQRSDLRILLAVPAASNAEPRFQFASGGGEPAAVNGSESNSFTAHRVSWPVFDDVVARGLLLVPRSGTGSNDSNAPAVILLQDRPSTSESLLSSEATQAEVPAIARSLVTNGWRVLVPERLTQVPGTNAGHGTGLLRQALALNHHLASFEVQSLIAASEAFQTGKVALAAFGDAGQLALYAAALEERIGAVLVSGFFGASVVTGELLVPGATRDFGHAELAALIAPRKVIVEFARTSAGNMEFADVEAEVRRAETLAAGEKHQRPFIEFVHGSEGSRVDEGSRKALHLLREAMGQSGER